jgi:integration host factor subunit alpha
VGALDGLTGAFITFRMNTVTRADLAGSIYAQVGLSRIDSAALVDIVLDRLSAILESGEPLKISGFGTFSVRQKGHRIGRNPKNGKAAPILARRVVAFRPSAVLKARVNDEAPGSDADQE